MSDKALYFNSGRSMRWVPEKYQPQKGEQIFDDLQSDYQLSVAFPDFIAAKNKEADIAHNTDIKRQLAEIDQKKVRAVTDAILNNDATRLKSLEEYAATLRKQLRQ